MEDSRGNGRRADLEWPSAEQSPAPGVFDPDSGSHAGDLRDSARAPTDAAGDRSILGEQFSRSRTRGNDHGS